MRDARIEKTEVLVDRYKRVVQETLRLDDGVTFDWVYLDTPKSVMIVALTPEREVVLVKQYRHNLRRDVVELPAGIQHDGETEAVAAGRELLEETGYRAGKLVDLGAHYTLPSETNRWTRYFLALDCTKDGEPKLDELVEKYFDMSVMLIPMDELKNVGEAAKAGIVGAESLFGLQLAREHLAGR